MQHQHGWEVELKCPVCAKAGAPTFDGWTANASMSFGDTPTIYANLRCRACSADLKAVAGEKLRELFADVAVPALNRRLIFWFVAFFFCFLILLIANVILPVSLPFLLPSLMGLAATARYWFNHQIASIRYRCDCGKPAYKFMGMLGRSYCYRCSSCGRLLLLRD
jgi:hypothetical protein